MAVALLPLILVVPRVMFQARFHVVTRVEVLAKDIDLSTGNVTADGVRIMQFDESLDLLNSQSLCSTQTNSDIQRNIENCDSFYLAPETSLEFCGTTGLTSASKRGQGSYYYPSAPEWDEQALAWNLNGGQRLYMTGSNIFHRLDDTSKPTVIFKGYPEFKGTETFWKLPCDKNVDEILLGLMLLIVFRLFFSAVLFFEEAAKMSYTIINESEPVRYGFRGNILLWITRLDYVCIFSGVIMLGVLYSETTSTERCKYDVPELYWASIFFMFYCFLAVVLLGLERLRTFANKDADPGKCNKTCQEKFSANVVLLPCGHMPGSKEPEGTPSQDSLRMCYACSHMHTECPVCKRLIESRKKINNGFYSSFLLALCCIVQMLIPAVNIKRIHKHSACFTRDIPPEEYSNGCMALLLILFLLMSVGVLGMSVASGDGREKRAAYVYRRLSQISCFLTGLTGLMFW
jgi:hypothetical protein